MPRLGSTALLEALERLFGLAFSTQKQSFAASYLAAKRIAAKGLEPSIQHTNEVVTELFVLVPNATRGRIAPFRTFDPLNSWLVSEDSGRKTVWDYCTRTGAGRVMFIDNHMSRGLRDDALSTLMSVLARPLPLEPLAVFLMRNEEWADEPDSAALTSRFMAFLGLSELDWGR